MQTTEPTTTSASTTSLKSMKIKAISAGTSKNGYVYTDECLNRFVSKGLFNHVPVYMVENDSLHQAKAKHPSLASAKGFIGMTRDARLVPANESKNGVSYVECVLDTGLQDSDDLIRVINNIKVLAESKGHEWTGPGISPIINPIYIDGNNVVREIKEVVCLDVVARPSAGGGFSESVEDVAFMVEMENMVKKYGLTEEDVRDVKDNTSSANISEGKKDIISKDNASKDNTSSANISEGKKEQKLAAMQSQLDEMGLKLKEQENSFINQSVIQDFLSNSSVPDHVKGRIREAAYSESILKDDPDKFKVFLSNTAQKEILYAQKFLQPSTGTAIITESDEDKLNDAVREFTINSLRGHHLKNSGELSWNAIMARHLPQHLQRKVALGLTSIAEAINTTDLPLTLAQKVNSYVQEYVPTIFEAKWMNFCPVIEEPRERVSFRNSTKETYIGSYELMTPLTESQEYQQASILPEKEFQIDPLNRFGMLETISPVAQYERPELFGQVMQKGMDAAHQTLESMVYQKLLTNPYFTAQNGNLITVTPASTAKFSASTYAAAITALLIQRDGDNTSATNKNVSIQERPYGMIIPVHWTKDVFETFAKSSIIDTFANAEMPMGGNDAIVYGLPPHYPVDSNFWFIFADPMRRPCMRVTVPMGQRSPVVQIQDPKNGSTNGAWKILVTFNASVSITNTLGLIKVVNS